MSYGHITELSGMINTISLSTWSLVADRVQRSLTLCVCWIAEKKLKIPNGLDLLDDFLVVVLPFNDAHKVM